MAQRRIPSGYGGLAGEGEEKEASQSLSLALQARSLVLSAIPPLTLKP